MYIVEWINYTGAKSDNVHRSLTLAAIHANMLHDLGLQGVVIMDGETWQKLHSHV